MNKLYIFFISTLILFSSGLFADENDKSELFRVRLFFGLSIPNGDGVSLNEWNEFQSQEIATAFEGFNIVDSTGFYKGKPERSKILTLIVKESEIEKVKSLARLYAQRFKQDSVMFVKVPVSEWDFIGAEANSSEQQLNKEESLTSEKKASIEELMEMTGILHIGEQMASVFVTQMVQNIKKDNPDIPERMFLILKEEVDNVIKTQAEANGGFADMAMPIYHKYFTHDDVKGLIKFYQTDLGKKTITVLPSIMQESIQAGQKWGESLEPLIQERISKRFKEEGFELE